MKFLIVKNITREGPGLLAEVLTDNQIEYDIIDLDKGDQLPVQTDQYSTLVILGGPDSANDQTAKMVAELSFVKAWLASKRSYLGICLGLQVMVKAAGGKVVPGDVPEIGFRNQAGELNTIETVSLTAAGQKDGLFTDLKSPFKVFHLHGETVELTDQMELLGIGQDCRNQIVKIGPAYGLQCHFELTHEMFETWLDQDPDLGAKDRTQLEGDWQTVQVEYADTGRKLLQNFINQA